MDYPSENSPLYECLQAHTSQEGWEPPLLPALRKLKDSAEPDAPEEIEIATE